MVSAVGLSLQMISETCVLKTWPSITAGLQATCGLSALVPLGISISFSSTWWTKHALGLSLRQTDIFFKGAQQSRKYSRCTPSLKSGFSKTHLRWKGAFLDPSLFKRVFSTVLAVWVDSTVVYRGFHLHGTNDSFRGLNATPYNPSSSQGDPRQLTGC